MKQSTVNVRGIVSWVKHVRRLILTSLTRLLNGSDAATQEGLLLVHGSSCGRVSFLPPSVTHVGISGS